MDTQRDDSAEGVKEVFARRWTRLELLHRGAESEVWRVEDRLNPGQEAALKRVAGFPQGSPRAARLAAEFRWLRGMSHPSLPEALDFAVDVAEGGTGVVTSLAPCTGRND